MYGDCVNLRYTEKSFNTNSEHKSLRLKWELIILDLVNQNGDHIGSVVLKNYI